MWIIRICAIWISRGGASPVSGSAPTIRNAGPAGVALTLGTIRDHVAAIARDMAIPATFRCSMGWVRRALRRNGIRCRSATGEAADQDHAAVRTCQDRLPQLLMYLAVRPRDVYNFDETALYLSVLPRKTYGESRVAGRKVAKERLTMGLLVNAEGTHAFRPLVISKAKRPRDFLPDYDPKNMLFTHFIEQLNATMLAKDRFIVILLDNASSHVIRSENAEADDMFGFRTRKLSNIRLVFLPPKTTAFTQPLDQGLIATTKIRYGQHWLRAFTQLWLEAGATTAAVRFRPNLRDVGLNNNGPNGGVNTSLAIDLDEEILDVGIMIGRLGLGASAMRAEEFVAVDSDQPTCAEPGPDPLAIEPAMAHSRASWEPPTTMHEVYEDENPETREARRTARAACEMLIRYARATCITPRDLCALFEIRNPIIIDRIERASPSINLNTPPLPSIRPAAAVLATASEATIPRRRGRVLPAWMTTPRRTRQELLDSGVGAVIGGYVDAAEWMALGSTVGGGGGEGAGGGEGGGGGGEGGGGEGGGGGLGGGLGGDGGGLGGGLGGDGGEGGGDFGGGGGRRGWEGTWGKWRWWRWAGCNMHREHIGFQNGGDAGKRKEKGQ
ncbi:unnamed protein product [Closterium sp. Yama58-4]|nr:unnamed protein product [Closterium sp. Yama58-4]